MSRTTRAPYTGSKAIDPSCRGHGSCPWCEGNRRHGDRKREIAALAQLAECSNCDRAVEGSTPSGGSKVEQNANWPAGFPDEPATWGGSVYFRLQYPKRFAHGEIKEPRS